MGVSIPVLAGIYTDSAPAVRVAYPINLVPVPGQEGIADGYLQPAEGITSFATGQGNDRGAITLPAGHAVGNGVHFRVSGTKLISVSAAGVVAVIGDVEGSGAARMDFSFDRIGVLSNGKLWYWNGTVLVTVTDPNIPANLIDMVWVDGYWMVTDGTDIAVSTLADPTVFNATKFGNTDRPDPVKALLKVLNEVHVISRSYIDVFQNVGGSGFPFARVNTAVITKGAIGTRTACVFQDTVALVGGDQKEAVGVYQAYNAKSTKVSTREIDKLLEGYTVAELASSFVEAVVDVGAQYIFIHLPDRALVYDAVASAAAQQPVWHVRTSAIDGFSRYKARNITRFGDSWVVGDSGSTAIGLWSSTVSSHFGSAVRWEFSTIMLRNSTKGTVMDSLEILALPGSVALGLDPMISTAYSPDGRTFGQERLIRSGKIGETTKRLIWFRQGAWKRFRIQRFRGDSGSRLSILSIDAELSPLEF